MGNNRGKVDPGESMGRLLAALLGGGLESGPVELAKRVLGDPGKTIGESEPRVIADYQQFEKMFNAVNVNDIKSMVVCVSFKEKALEPCAGCGKFHDGTGILRFVYGKREAAQACLILLDDGIDQAD